MPTIFAMLLQMDLSAFDLSSLRYLTNTAAALPASHILELRTTFPRARLYSMYGLTETKRTLYLPPEELDRRPGSVGHRDSGHRGLGRGRGRRQRSGPARSANWWSAAVTSCAATGATPEATAQRYRPGPLPGERVCHTGDLFRMDEEGYFYFVGRKDDIIKSRGEKVAPKEVENVLYALPGVVEAAVIGVPDPLLGEAVKAFVVVNGPRPDRGATSSPTAEAHLEDFMVPKYVEFRDELPKTASGKIKKTGLASGPPDVRHRRTRSICAATPACRSGEAEPAADAGDDPPPRAG